ncbi:hypothetical protein VOLCADRAFT_103590 [Volvox carteri f. nagariensis]|uniref:Uncharacterized protein n=1 Tax=Volvox carteri f. nagariensis TaxID=3068 RepID=D8TN05_VOLCA|nr:uncharacterized protein VOLCADRAFT_103590 [Volvox carteri f. nagariensis]EFJ51344.1 hypothetical protein VOLCADRAFT_103590 [Volvox carteri f. nagariensis]|eukprot:XP_002947811.1 hypothetical protein VOLCADRAFT_103590 [Volvox carteri f. nagariensis]
MQLIFNRSTVTKPARLGSGPARRDELLREAAQQHLLAGNVEHRTYPNSATSKLTSGPLPGALRHPLPTKLDATLPDDIALYEYYRKIRHRKAEFFPTVQKYISTTSTPCEKPPGYGFQRVPEGMSSAGWVPARVLGQRQDSYPGSRPDQAPQIVIRMWFLHIGFSSSEASKGFREPKITMSVCALAGVRASVGVRAKARARAQPAPLHTVGYRI